MRLEDNVSGFDFFFNFICYFFFSEIKRKHVMAKLRAVALANPREKHQWVVDSLLQSIPDSVQDLLPGPEKLKGMVKNIRYCNAEFQVKGCKESTKRTKILQPQIPSLEELYV